MAHLSAGALTKVFRSGVKGLAKWAARTKSTHPESYVRKHIRHSTFNYQGHSGNLTSYTTTDGEVVASLGFVEREEKGKKDALLMNPHSVNMIHIADDLNKSDAEDARRKLMIQTIWRLQKTGFDTVTMTDLSNKEHVPTERLLMAMFKNGLIPKGGILTSIEDFPGYYEDTYNSDLTSSNTKGGSQIRLFLNERPLSL